MVEFADLQPLIELHLAVLYGLITAQLGPAGLVAAFVMTAMALGFILTFSGLYEAGKRVVS